MEPLVSILIPAYNVENFLVEREAPKIIHLKINGEDRSIRKFIELLRNDSEIGPKVTTIQRYGKDKAAVNIEAKSQFDHEKLYEAANSSDVEIELFTN